MTKFKTPSNVSIFSRLLHGLPFLVAMILVLISGVSLFSQARASDSTIVSSPQAPADRAPQINKAYNDVPVVNIVTPNEKGLSHNQYQSFDVGTQGAVLNNVSDSHANSKLGGRIIQNPNLAQGPASMILNEVRGTRGSYLGGDIEVAGHRADVIIANEAGVACNGCGFINTSNVTLSTGTPDFSSGDLQLKVQNYHSVDITGRGVVFKPLDKNGGVISDSLFKILAGRIILDGVIDSTGSVELNAKVSSDAPGAGRMPTHINSTALGGVFGSRIIMKAENSGYLGVNLNGGEYRATAGDMEISTDGNLVVKRDVKLRSEGDMLIKAKSHDNHGSIKSNTGLVRFGSSQAFKNHGSIEGRGVVIFDPRIGPQGFLDSTVSNFGTIKSHGSLEIINSGIFKNEKAGSIYSEGDMLIAGKTRIENHGSVTSTKGQMTFKGEGRFRNYRDARITGDGILIDIKLPEEKTEEAKSEEAKSEEEKILEKRKALLSVANIGGKINARNLFKVITDGDFINIDPAAWDYGSDKPNRIVTVSVTNAKQEHESRNMRRYYVDVLNMLLTEYGIDFRARTYKPGRKPSSGKEEGSSKDDASKTSAKKSSDKNHEKDEHLTELQKRDRDAEAQGFTVEYHSDRFLSPMEVQMLPPEQRNLYAKLVLFYQSYGNKGLRKKLISDMSRSIEESDKDPPVEYDIGSGPKRKWHYWFTRDKVLTERFESDAFMWSRFNSDYAAAYENDVDAGRYDNMLKNPAAITAGVIELDVGGDVKNRFSTIKADELTVSAKNFENRSALYRYKIRVDLINYYHYHSAMLYRLKEMKARFATSADVLVSGTATYNLSGSMMNGPDLRRLGTASRAISGLVGSKLATLHDLNFYQSPKHLPIVDEIGIYPKDATQKNSTKSLTGSTISRVAPHRILFSVFGAKYNLVTARMTGKDKVPVEDLPDSDPTGGAGSDKNYLSKDYIKNKFGLDLDKHFDKDMDLGSARDQYRMVSSQLLQLPGTKYIYGKKTPQEVMKILYDNSYAYALEHGLAYGKELTEEQVKNLDENIVWFEEHVGDDGVTRVIPRVYVAPRYARREGGVLQATNLSINAKDSVVNGGSIIAKNDFEVTGGNYINKGLVSQGSADGEAGVHVSGTYSAKGGDTYISSSKGFAVSAQNIILGSVMEREYDGENFQDKARGGITVSKGVINYHAKGTISSYGGTDKASDDIIYSGNNGVNFYKTKLARFDKEKGTRTDILELVKSVRKVFIKDGLAKILLDQSKIVSKNYAKFKKALESSSDVEAFLVALQKIKFNLSGDDKSELYRKLVSLFKHSLSPPIPADLARKAGYEAKEVIHDVAKIRSGGDVLLKSSHGGALLQGTSVKAKKNLVLDTKEDITIGGAASKEVVKVRQEMTSNRYSLEQELSAENSRYRGSVLDAKNIKIVSNHADVNIIGSQLSAKNALSISAEDINIFAGYNLSGSVYSQTENKSFTDGKIFSERTVTESMNLKKAVKSSLSGGNMTFKARNDFSAEGVEAIALGKIGIHADGAISIKNVLDTHSMDVSSAILNIGSGTHDGQWARTIVDGKAGSVSAEAGWGITYSESHELTSDKSVNKSSFVSVNESILLDGKKSVFVQGSDLEAIQGDVDVMTDGDFNLLDAHDVIETKESAYSLAFSQTAKAQVSLPPALGIVTGIGMDIAAAVGERRRQNAKNKILSSVAEAEDIAVKLSIDGRIREGKASNELVIARLDAENARVRKGLAIQDIDYFDARSRRHLEDKRRYDRRAAQATTSRDNFKMKAQAARSRQKYQETQRNLAIARNRYRKAVEDGHDAKKSANRALLQLRRGQALRTAGSILKRKVDRTSIPEGAKATKPVNRSSFVTLDTAIEANKKLNKSVAKHEKFQMADDNKKEAKRHYSMTRIYAKRLGISDKIKSDQKKSPHKTRGALRANSVFGGVSASVGYKMGAEWSSSSSEKKDSVASNIKAKNITIKAKNATIRGSNVNATNLLKARIEENLKIEAGVNSDTSQSKEENFSASFTPSISGTGTFTWGTSVGGGFDEQNQSSISHSASSFSGKNVDIKATSLHSVGSDIKATEDVKIQADTVKLEASKDVKTEYRNQLDMTVSASVSGDLKDPTGAAVSGGVSGERNYRDVYGEQRRNSTISGRNISITGKNGQKNDSLIITGGNIKADKIAKIKTKNLTVTTDKNKTKIFDDSINFSTSVGVATIKDGTSGMPIDLKVSIEHKGEREHSSVTAQRSGISAGNLQLEADSKEVRDSDVMSGGKVAVQGVETEDTFERTVIDKKVPLNLSSNFYESRDWRVTNDTHTTDIKDKTNLFDD